MEINRRNISDDELAKLLALLRVKLERNGGIYKNGYRVGSLNEFTLTLDLDELMRVK